MSQKVGHKLADLEVTIRIADMVAYAGATWDWHRIHYDRDMTDKAGLKGPVVDGQMLGAYLARQITESAGVDGFIKRMSIRYRSTVHAGDSITCEARITGLEADEITLEQVVKIGDRVVAEGAAVLAR